MKKFLKGRLIVLFLFSGIFVSLAFGQMGLFNTGEIQFPSQEILIISKVEEDKENVYKALNEIVKSDNIRLYRSVIEDGKNKAFVFGKLPEKFNHPMTQSKETLEALPVIGNYFIDGKLSQASQQKLNKIKMTYQTGGTGWEGIAGQLLLGFSGDSQTFYITLLLFGVTLYAFKMARARKRMIARSLGKTSRNIFPELAVLLFGLVFFGLIGSILEKYIGTILFSTVFFLIGIIAVILVLITLLVNILFSLFIRTTPVIAILKNKVSGSFFHYLWLLVIAISIGMMTVAIGSSLRDYQLGKERQKTLTKWERFSDFSSVQFRMPKYEVERQKNPAKSMTMEQMEKYRIARNENELKKFSFYSAVPEEDKVLIYKPLTGGPIHGVEEESYPAPDFNNPNKMIKLDAKWLDAVWHVNPNLIKISQEVNKDNPDIFADEKAVTLYIPQKYASEKDKILPTITSNFIRTGLKASDFEIKIIPNGFKLFVPHLQNVKDERFLDTMTTDAVIAQYNDKKMPRMTQMSSALVNGMFTAIYRQDKINTALKKSGLDKEVGGFTNPFAILKSYQKETESQIQRSIFAIITLFIAQIFVLYQFVKLRLEVKMRKIAIGQVLGNNQFLEYLKVFGLVFVSIALGLAYAFNEQATGTLLALSGLSYVLLTIVILALAIYRLLRKRVNILKGEGEIL